MEPWVIATSLIFSYLIFTLILGLIANRRLEKFVYGQGEKAYLDKI